jgi:glyoxylase-like metal-dependent hydrolase (beta-lactamase superfamily II)
MKLHALHCGSMFVDESSLTAGIRNASLRNQNPAAQWVEIPVCAYLLETSCGYVLYDTGCNEREALIAPEVDTPSPYVYSPGQLLPEQLAKLEVSPEDIKHVVISHLHCDHTGYLYLFRNAEIVAADAEFTGAMRLFGLRGFGAGPYKTEDFDAFLGNITNWKLLENDEIEYEICQGVRAVNFGAGHTFGMLGLLVELPQSGNLLLCSDALYRSDNLGPPIKPPGLIYDSLGYVRSANFIARYAKKHNAKIIFGHDMRQFAEMLSGGGVFD